jgi:hypothetical protein
MESSKSAIAASASTAEQTEEITGPVVVIEDVENED